jgi:hypothetical protein
MGRSLQVGQELRPQEEAGNTELEGHASPPVVEGTPSAISQKSPFFYQGRLLSARFIRRGQAPHTVVSRLYSLLA